MRERQFILWKKDTTDSSYFTARIILILFYEPNRQTSSTHNTLWSFQFYVEYFTISIHISMHICHESHFHVTLKMRKNNGLFIHIVYSNVFIIIGCNQIFGMWKVHQKYCKSVKSWMENNLFLLYSTVVAHTKIWLILNSCPN